MYKYMHPIRSLGRDPIFQSQVPTGSLLSRLYDRASDASSPYYVLCTTIPVSVRSIQLLTTNSHSLRLTMDATPVTNRTSAMTVAVKRSLHRKTVSTVLFRKSHAYIHRGM